MGPLEWVIKIRYWMELVRDELERSSRSSQFSSRHALSTEVIALDTVGACYPKINRPPV